MLEWVSAAWSRFVAWLGPPTLDPLELEPSRRDIAAVAVMAVIVVVEAADVLSDPFAGLRLGAGVMMALAIFPRRRWPLTVLLVAMGLDLAGVGVRQVASEPIQATVALGVGQLWALYNCVRWTAQARARWMLAGVALASAFTFLPAPDQTPSQSVQAVAVTLLLAAAAVSRRQYAVRAEQRRRLVELETRHALANEVHDIVGHHLSAIALRTEAAIAQGSADRASVDLALASIRGAATSALVEMRRVVTELTEIGDQQPRPSAATLAALVALSTDEGVKPAVHVTAKVDCAAVSPQLMDVTYRVAQEAITNARQHAQSANRIDIAVHARADELTLLITDNGAASAADPGGLGLPSMRRRVHGAGGRFEAGPVTGGGWRVLARLPIGSEPLT